MFDMAYLVPLGSTVATHEPFPLYLWSAGVLYCATCGARQARAGRPEPTRLTLELR